MPSANIQISGGPWIVRVRAVYGWLKQYTSKTNVSHWQPKILLVTKPAIRAHACSDYAWPACRQLPATDEEAAPDAGHPAFASETSDTNDHIILDMIRTLLHEPERKQHETHTRPEHRNTAARAHLREPLTVSTTYPRS